LLSIWNAFIGLTVCLKRFWAAMVSNGIILWLNLVSHISVLLLRHVFSLKERLDRRYSLMIALLIDLTV